MSNEATVSSYCVESNKEHLVYIYIYGDPQKTSLFNLTSLRII